MFWYKIPKTVETVDFCCQQQLLHPFCSTKCSYELTEYFLALAFEAQKEGQGQFSFDGCGYVSLFREGQSWLTIVYSRSSVWMTCSSL